VNISHPGGQRYLVRVLFNDRQENKFSCRGFWARCGSIITDVAVSDQGSS
jgi:hypothetical protein